jgi:glycosyltransferase involved in cell wall biosynthesis
MVEAWQQEKLFPIHYVWQENAGKHIAINRGVQIANGDFFLNADSDDAFLPHALDTFYKHWQDIPHSSRHKYAGICGLCQYENGQIVGDLFPRDIFDSTSAEIFHRYHVHGEKWCCIRTEVMREFPFTEKVTKSYVTENFVWRPMGQKYLTRYINEVVRVYFTDQTGYMRGKTRVRHPASGHSEHLFYLNEEMPEWWKNDLFEFARSAVHYSRFSFHIGKGPITQFRSLENGLARTVWVCALPIGFSVYMRDKLMPLTN